MGFARFYDRAIVQSDPDLLKERFVIDPVEFDLFGKGNNDGTCAGRVTMLAFDFVIVRMHIFHIISPLGVFVILLLNI